MKKLIALALAAGALAPAFAETNVGVSIGVYQPGVYGRIDIGNAPPPRYYNVQPVIIAPPPVYVAQPQPLYLYVPPGHQKHWEKHCSRYNACGQPVYFVREDWVRERYEEQRHHRDHDDHDGDRGHGKDHRKFKNDRD